ncbi:ABC transporter ATP-binding protein [Bacillus sp. JJ722]|uniref:ABC transporter ATP-binding protein n=1 Tax=Bacillus sp. JJ722 TaxID=3122973 RepID=UPI002FFD8584
MSFVKLSNVYKVYNEKVLAIDDFNLDIESNEFVALIGPSGCGKSTLLRMIAGLEEITDGELSIGGKVVNDVHAKDRDISMVFQNYALYPHMTIYDNIAFGLKLQKEDKAVIAEKVNAVSETLGLTEHLKKTPSELSGGQRQRVALGRAMVQESKIFLMDEPLSNLDAKLRSKMRMEILSLHRELGITTIYVTHDQVEAMTMADKIVVMKDGVMQQVGSPKDLYYKPANEFVAKFIGDPEINILEGFYQAGKFELDGYNMPIPEGLQKKLAPYSGKVIHMGIRPEDVRSEQVFLDTYADTRFETSIEIVEMRGDELILTTKLANQFITSKTSSYMDYHLGDQITLAINPNKVHFFDAATGVTI